MFLAGLLSVLTISVVTVAGAEENASNPLAAVNNTDLRYQYTEGDLEDVHRLFIDGAYMVTPKLKLKYELHYIETDQTGEDEHDFEKIILKPIYFPFEKKLNDEWGLRAAIGADLIVEFDNDDKGIGVGADQIGPFGGFAFANLPSGLVLIPLLQQFLSFSGDTDVNQTALRLIGLKPFGKGNWFKLDAKFPYDWENEIWVPTTEVQLGHNFGPKWAIFVDGLAGLGGDRLYDAGIGLGLRRKF
jgi:hypothetical protein